MLFDTESTLENAVTETIDAINSIPYLFLANRVIHFDENQIFGKRAIVKCELLDYTGFFILCRIIQNLEDKAVQRLEAEELVMLPDVRIYGRAYSDSYTHKIPIGFSCKEHSELKPESGDRKDSLYFKQKRQEAALAFWHDSRDEFLAASGKTQQR